MSKFYLVVRFVKVFFRNEKTHRVKTNNTLCVFSLLP